MQHSFRGQLHDEIVYAFAAHDPKLRPIFVTAVKEDEYGPDALISQLDELCDENWLRDSDAFVMVPTQSPHLTRRLAEHQRNETTAGRSLPVVALTVPFAGDAFERLDLPQPPVVISNNRQGSFELGEKAGAACLDYVAEDGIRVLVVPGARQSDSVERTEGFLSGLRSELGQIRIDVQQLRAAQWSRSTAFSAVKDYLNSRDAKRIDILLGGNDDIALGARDAITRMTDNLPDLIARTSIYGYDAIDEARWLLRNKDAFFRGTVDQNLGRMASQLAELVWNLISGVAGRLQPTYLVPPNVIVVHPATSGDPNTPDIPAWNPKHWLDASDAAETAGVATQSLRRARAKDRANYVHEDGMFGIDSVGRIWRRQTPGGKKVWYLERTLRR